MIILLLETQTTFVAGSIVASDPQPPCASFVHLIETAEWAMYTNRVQHVDNLECGLAATDLQWCALHFIANVTPVKTHAQLM